MFCAACGKENHEANKYCRACRENLQLVSQAMKGHLPIKVATKVDAVLDSRSERFRRDSFLTLLMSVTVLFGGFISWQAGQGGFFSVPLIFISLGLFYAKQALFEYRAYKRSISPSFDWTGSDQDQVGSVPYRLGRSIRTLKSFVSKCFTSRTTTSKFQPESGSGGSPQTGSAAYFSDVSLPRLTEGTTDQRAELATRPIRRPDTLYCPQCGTQNEQRAGHCEACRVNLDVVARALELGETDSRTAKLDRYIRGKNKRLDAVQKLASPWFWLACAVFYGIERSMPGWWFYLLTAVVSFVQSSWDRVTYGRNPTEQKSTTGSVDDNLLIDAATRPSIDQSWEIFSPDGKVLRINDATTSKIFEE